MFAAILSGIPTKRTASGSKTKNADAKKLPDISVSSSRWFIMLQIPVGYFHTEAKRQPISYSAHSFIHLISQPLRHKLLQFWFAHITRKKLLVEFHALNEQRLKHLAEDKLKFIE